MNLDGRFHKQPELSKFMCIKYVFQGIVTGHAYEMLLFSYCTDPEDGGRTFLRNINELLSDCTVS
jgi:hypothetical protein